MTAPDRLPSPRLPVSWAVAIVLVAVAVRVAVVVSTADDPLFATPMLDAEYMVDWARSVQAGDVWGSPEGTAYFRTPLYAWFLAGAFALPGPDLPTARLLQALLGGLVALWAAEIALRRFGRTAALATGALAALAWPLLLFGRELLIAPLVVFLATAFLRVWDGATARSGPGRWLALGVLLGLGALARPNLLAFLPVGLALAALGPGGRSLRRPLLLLLGTTALVAPITLRNHRVSGDWILLSSQAGLNLWIGNHPGADGMSAVLPGFSSWRNEDVEAALARETGGPVGPAAQDAHFRALTRDAIRADPLGAAARLAKKTWLFLQGYEIRNNRDLYFLRERNAILRMPLPDFGWILPLALVGMWTTRRRWRELAPLLGWTVTSAAGVIAFFVCARYRLVAWPALLPFAGAGVAAVLDRGASGRVRAARATALVALVLLARVDPIGVRTPDPSQPWFQVGNVQARLGRWDAAEAAYRKALALAPGFAEARHHLGALLLRRGRPDEALAWLRPAAAALPESFRVRRSLAEALEATGRIEEALAVRREAARLSAGADEDRAALANTLGMAGRLDEAWAIQEDLARGPMAADPWFQLNAGQTALAVGREAEGLALLDRAVHDDATRRGAWGAIARWHLAQRRPADALPPLSEALLRFPDDAELHRLRAVARYALGDATGATEDLERVLEIDPADVDSRRKLDEIRSGPAGRR